METKENQALTFIASLENRLEERSNFLEDAHMEAAIDAQLTTTTSSNSSVFRLPEKNDGKTGNGGSRKIFDDYVNPHAVENCLSPYVPSKADNIAAFLSFVDLSADDVLLDIGCGDGRVCIAATSTIGCRAIGIDVSPLCVESAKKSAREEGIREGICSFFEADMTIDPSVLLSDSSPIAKDILSVSVVYLYTYPTLLNKLVPLLACLFEKRARAVVTLTYHLPDTVCTIGKVDTDHDFRLYTNVEAQNTGVKNVS